MLRSKPALFLLSHLAALATVAVTTLLLRPFSHLLSIQIIVLLYLLPVIISTVLWGLTPGLLAGFAAFLSFNFFFLQPLYTLQVHALQDLITLIIFLVVVVIMSQLIGQAREGIRLARSREREATRMYELISALSGLQDARSIAGTLAEHALETFHCTRVEVLVDPQKFGELPPTVLPVGSAAPIPPTTRIRLVTASEVEGELRLWLPRPDLGTEETRLLEAYASQAALSLERARLTTTENRTRVLEESDRLKSSLLNSVSHELRSPLAAIKASVSSLRDSTVDWDSAARQELLATIEEETDHLNLLVGNLLDMSRIESGALKPNKRWNSISEIALGVVTKMRKQLQDHQLDIALPDDLPLVPTDYVMIGQVFTNLLSNSTKYAPPDTQIQLSAHKEGDCVHVQVANQGPPVPQEHLERIFDKFYRVTAAERITGTGLGLSICKGIIEAHGGRIWAENQPGRFIFHFTLPLTLDGALPEIPTEAGDG